MSVRRVLSGDLPSAGASRWPPLSPRPRTTLQRRTTRHARSTLGAVFMAVVLLLVSVPGEAGLADQVGATFGLLVQEVMNAFPAVEGLVVSVDGDRVYLDLTEKDGVQRGQEFTVFRKGEEFVHPVSRKPLGRFEDVLGYAQITRVEPRFSEALFIPVPDREKVAAEDGVRITRGRIKVAVAPTLDLTKTHADLRRVPFMIALGLDQTKRFQAVDPGVVQELFLNQRARIEELLVRPERAVSLGRTLDVSGWLIPVLIDRRGVTYLDVTWISAVTGTPLFSRRQALTRAQGASEQRFPWEPLPED